MMTSSSAQQVVIVSAAAVAGLWAYQQYQQGGKNLDLGHFATAWAAVFLVLAVVAMAAPQLAAAFAMLVVVGDLLVNLKVVGSGANSTLAFAGGTGQAAAPLTVSGSKDVQQLHTGQQASVKATH